MSETGSSPETSKGRAPGKGTDGETSTSGTGADRPTTPGKDPLRGSRTSGIWAAVVALVAVLVLLSVFVLQNTQSVEVTFLGWQGKAPLAAALLIAVAAGLLLAVTAGSLRILQLRRRVRHGQKH